MEQIEHNIDPFFDLNSQILILGSFPSPKSRKTGFYYGHPRNRFWKTLCGAFNDKIVPNSIFEKKQYLKTRKIALWDVVASCQIHGASDSSIKNVYYNDLHYIINTAPIQLIVTTGKKADSLFRKRWSKDPVINKISYLNLPSTSPANASMNLAQLIKNYHQIIDVLRRKDKE
ncbi:MAG: DNA-deoxyinosine glycosylase [Eubacteriaceae bacterium]|jgi:TDG/mug DNA glycosylase family protein|uniref:DNA-deoxyinosine glycosylase n=1 Tax=Candidatus Pseudoramibacter fermentans TaxID=2594427 RepID=A0A6L5GRW1_9FIRM|nr:DNA-deoxyinosine glycosylase [Candidatus Pseudoramibacter fermentans]RRF93824.1 MAG: DNA-deoxyinosine glycosylase [Eubacteriaceae bacterium]